MMSLLIQPELEPTESILGKVIDAMRRKTCQNEAKKGKLSQKCIRFANEQRRKRSIQGKNRDGTKK